MTFFGDVVGVYLENFADKISYVHSFHDDDDVLFRSNVVDFYVTCLWILTISSITSSNDQSQMKGMKEEEVIVERGKIVLIQLQTCCRQPVANVL